MKLYQFLFIDNVNWTACVIVWLSMVGMIFLFAEAPTPKLLNVKRIVGSLVFTLWIWGVMFAGLYVTQYPPVLQRHTTPPDYWWRGGKTYRFPQ